MAMLFRSTPGPTRINQAQINQSVLGYPVIALMGKGKVQQSIIWLDGFSATLVNTQGGKGTGGGKGGSQNAYSGDVIAALCDGGIHGVVGIGDVWSGQSWLSNNTTTETTVITGGTYTPANASNMTADMGVGISHAVSGSFSDVGSTAPTVISGSVLAPLQRQPYGVTLSSGQYSVNPANNQYSFAAADIGQTVTLFYSFSLSSIKKQLVAIVPSSRSITVGTNTDDEAYSTDNGLEYYSAEGDPHNGVALTRVNGTPTVTGTYQVALGVATWSTGTPSYESQPATYNFAAGDINKEVLITYAVKDPANAPVGTQSSLSFMLMEGTVGQAPWSLLETSFPGAALGYSGICLVCYGPMDLGYSGQIQNNVFEVMTYDGWGAGIADCSPVQCILQVSTNPVWGLGAGPVPFPTAVIDNGPYGTWGTPGAQSIVRQDGTAVSWFAANGFFISPVVDRQDTAASLIGKWLEAGQCAAFMSEGLWKLAPYGDTTTSGNGCVWTAPSTFGAALDDTCFLKKGKGKKASDPVKISSSPYLDGYTTVRVSWSNPAHQYAPEITTESDQAAINRYGNRIEDPQSWEFITSLASATFAASMRVKRMVYIRNTFEFSLPYQYVYLEPMDVVYISTESIWSQGLNNQNLAIVELPVRITKIVDNPDGTLDVTCEDYPFGVNEPTVYNKGLSTGEPQPNHFSDPGDSQVVIFNATGRLTANQGNQIWFGATGASADWGGCDVLVSMDGDTYIQLGEVTGQSRLGSLGAALPYSSDPDTTDNMVVNLAPNSPSLESATTANADAGATLCYVDGECVSYSAASCTDKDQYTATGYIRRGQMGTPIASHASGSPFLRLDGTVLRYTYDPSWAGKTIYLKFPSFNIFNNSTQDPSTLTPLSFAVAAASRGSLVITGTTPHPTLSTTAPADLPELGTSNTAMTIKADGQPVQIGVNLVFQAGSLGAADGMVESIGTGFSSFGGSGLAYPPSIDITITGDGAGAGASVWFSSDSSIPPNFTPNLYVYGGSGYTHATATVVVSGSTPGTGYSDGTSTYTCDVSGIAPVSGVPVKTTVSQDGTVVIGPLVTLTDAKGTALVSASQLLFPAVGNHSYVVQAENMDTAYTVQSTNRSFQYIVLG